MSADAPQTEQLEFPDHWPLIPCDSDKVPYVEWKPLQVKGAMTPPEQLREWQEMFRPACWAVVCGDGRCVVLDFEPEGMPLVTAWGLDPHVETPSGGAHVYVAHPGWYVRTFNVKSQAPWHVRYPGLDVRADGGIAIVAGQTRKGRYRLLRPLDPDPLDVLPEEVRDALGLLHPPPAMVDLGRAWRAVSGNGASAPGAGADGSDWLLFEALDMAWSKQGRDNSCYWLMRALRDHGYDRADAEAVGKKYCLGCPSWDTKGASVPFTVRDMSGRLDSAYRDAPHAPHLLARCTWSPDLDERGRSVLHVTFSDGSTMHLHVVRGVPGDGDGGPNSASGGSSAPPQEDTRQDQQQQPRHRRVVLVPFEEIDARPLTTRSFLVTPHVARREAHLLFGPPRNWKSFLTMEWSLSVALGRPLLGAPAFLAEAGLVFYFDMENDQDYLRARVRASLARAGLTPADLHGRFVPQDTEADIKPWRMERDALIELAENVDRLCPDLVVIDNLRKVMPAGKSENSTDEVNPLLEDVLAACKMAKAAFLLVHHTNRGEEDYAGGGGIESTIGNVARIKRDWTTGIATVTCKSTRHGPEWDEFAVCMGPDGALRLPDALSPDSFERICAFLAKGGEHPPAAIAKEVGLSRDTVDRALPTLLKEKRVMIAGKDTTATRGKKALLYALAVDLSGIVVKDA